MGGRDRVLMLGIIVAAGLVTGIAPSVAGAAGVRGIESESASLVAAQAAKAMGALTSFRYDQVVGQGEHAATLDLLVGANGDAEGTASNRGAHLRLLRIGATSYLLSNAAGLTEFGLSASFSRQNANRWFVGPTDSGPFSDFAGFDDEQMAVTLFEPPADSYLRVGTSTVGGRPTVEITAADRSFTFSVAATGPPYVVKVTSRRPGGLRSAVLSDFDLPLHPTPPVHASDIGSLQLANNEAQADLYLAIAYGKSLYTQNGAFPVSGIVDQFSSVDSSLTYTAGPATSGPNPPEVSVIADSTGQILIAAAQSSDGRCWYAEDDESGSTALGGLPAGVVTTAPGASYAGSPAGVRQANCPTATLPAYLTTTSWASTYPA